MNSTLFLSRLPYIFFVCNHIRCIFYGKMRSICVQNEQKNPRKPLYKRVPGKCHLFIFYCSCRLGRVIVQTNDKQPRMLVIHISDLYQKHTLDNIYPVHFNQVYRGYMPVSESGRRIFFQGKDSFALYLLPDTILWVESTNNGRSSIIHTNNAEYHVKATTVELEREHPDFLIRCHRCHLVNPKHIVCIKRFNVTLSDGKEIPIPEKKYTAFKKTVHDHVQICG